ncbi:DJ-1/PfpI family protein [Roseiarcus sp.]|uniref:DJ-1/PfpI family protein n=1 Tax=Roseiarcus sp. TaxID=1969460 RepID=UPI003F959AAF
MARISRFRHGQLPRHRSEKFPGCDLSRVYNSIRKDVENAGAQWVDEAVVVHRGVITSRNPDDLGAFVPRIIEEVQKGDRSTRAAQ